jgi:hypothetical protein
MKEQNSSRRAFVRKAAYVAPAVLSLQAFSAVAKAGSYKDEKPDKPPKPKKPTKPKKPPKPKRPRKP